MSDSPTLFASSLPIEVRPSKPKYVLLILVLTAAAAFSTWLVTSGQVNRTWVAVLCAVCCGLGAAFLIYILCSKRPLVLLDDQGITVRGWKGCPVAWRNIERVWKSEQRVSTMYSSTKADYVCMALKQSDHWLRSQGPIRGKFAALGRSMGYGDIYFSTKGMNFNADALVMAIRTHIDGAHLSGLPNLAPDIVGSDA